MLLPPDAVPEEWMDRAIPMMLIPLLPGEASRALGAGAAEREITREEEDVAWLVARGLTVGAIARQLGVSPRSVNRRLARLRERLGVASTAELATELASRGFSWRRSSQPLSEVAAENRRITNT